MNSHPLEILGVVVGILDRLGIEYVVGGSLASTLYGEARFTRDADLVVDLREEQVDALARALEPDFHLSRDAMREAVRERDSFNAIHPESGFKVDFFVLGRGAFDLEEFRRRVPLPAGSPSQIPIMFKTPEDTVLRKLHWYRKGGEASEQQWNDVLGVLAISRGQLDESYLTRWAAELGVSDLLVKAREAIR